MPKGIYKHPSQCGFQKGHRQFNTGRTHIKKRQHISPKTEFKKGMTSWLKDKHIQTNTGKTHFKKGSISWNKDKKMTQISGKKHWNWQGGKSPLSHLIRNLLENKQWIKNIFKRDNYTCQICNQHGGDLEAHHIKQFAKILSEFLKEYDQFSPIEDKETLVRLAMKYKPFWNINNGKTLCKDCHNKTKIGSLI